MAKAVALLFWGVILLVGIGFAGLGIASEIGRMLTWIRWGFG